MSLLGGEETMLSKNTETEMVFFLKGLLKVVYHSDESDAALRSINLDHDLNLLSKMSGAETSPKLKIKLNYGIIVSAKKAHAWHDVAVKAYKAACAKLVPYQEVYEDSRDWEGIIVSTVWDVKSYFNDLHC